MTARDTAGGARPGAPRRRVAVLVLFVALVVAAVASFKVHHTVEHDNHFCAASCHHKGDAGSEFHANGHEALECQTCHTLPLRDGLKLLWQATVAKAEKPTAHGKPDGKRCASCHESRMSVWRLVAETEGHRQHRIAKDVDCLSCHRQAIHHERPTEALCTGCHEPKRLHKTTAEAETCLSCHSFALSKKYAQQPTTIACEKCHGNAAEMAALRTGDAKALTVVDANALHGGLECKLCHDPHGNKPLVPEGQPVCVRCHRFEIFSAGGVPKTGPEGHRNCEGCHRPHAPRKHALDSCVRCHETRAKGPKGAATAGKAASTALQHTSCASCHLPHSWRAERSGCVTCHEDKAAIAATRTPKGHGTCMNCHDVHGPPPSGAICTKCHTDKQRHVAVAPAKHKDCVSCHEPHTASREGGRAACAKCHTEQLAQVVRDGPEGHEKPGCFGCHQPHENPLPKESGCAKCHEEKAKAVAAGAASPPKHKVCTSCHQKHVFKIKEIGAACSKCHAPVIQAVQAGGPHKGDCTKCHTLHGSPGVAKTACFQCHSGVQAAFKPPNAAHDKCRSCHQPHTPAATAKTKCASCHEAKTTVAASWPPSSPHRDTCVGCHTQHDVRTKKPCQSCHEKEGASALGGKHVCTGCHSPHKETPGAGPAWWTRCATCHQDKAESVKARGPKHAECKNCHQPHKFAVPTCTSCHTGMEAKGAHAVKEHAAKCNACHDPHTTASPARAPCLACHTDKRDHQPEAQRCQACHPFQ